MTEFIVKSDRADAVKSEVQSALENQRRAVQDSLKRTERNIAALEAKYGFDTAGLLNSEGRGSLDDSNLEFIEWLGEAKTLEYLKSELELLSDIKVC
jgi:Skp family chaperone for outer membrane proteins